MKENNRLRHSSITYFSENSGSSWARIIICEVSGPCEAESGMQLTWTNVRVSAFNLCFKLLGFHNFVIDVSCFLIDVEIEYCYKTVWDCVLAGYEEPRDSGDQWLLSPTSHPALLLMLARSKLSLIIQNAVWKGKFCRESTSIMTIHCLVSSPWHSGQSRSRRWGWKISEIFKKKARHKMSTGD